MNSNNIEVEQ